MLIVALMRDDEFMMKPKASFYFKLQNINVRIFILFNITYLKTTLE